MAATGRQGRRGPVRALAAINAAMVLLVVARIVVRDDWSTLDWVLALLLLAISGTSAIVYGVRSFLLPAR